MVEIRQADESDLGIVVELFEESGAAVYLNAGATAAEVEAFLARRDWRQFWAEKIQGSGSVVLLAEAGGAVIGTGSLALEEDGVAILSGAYVRHQGQGIGKAITEALLDEAVRRGARAAELITAANNSAVLALAERYGFDERETISSNRFADVPWFRLRKNL